MLEFEQYKLDLGAMEKDIAELYEALGIENEKKKLAELEEKALRPTFTAIWKLLKKLSVQ